MTNPKSAGRERKHGKASKQGGDVMVQAPEVIQTTADATAESSPSASTAGGGAGSMKKEEEYADDIVSEQDEEEEEERDGDDDAAAGGTKMSGMSQIKRLKGGPSKRIVKCFKEGCWEDVLNVGSKLCATHMMEEQRSALQPNRRNDRYWRRMQAMSEEVDQQEAKEAAAKKKKARAKAKKSKQENGNGSGGGATKKRKTIENGAAAVQNVPTSGESKRKRGRPVTPKKGQSPKAVERKEPIMDDDDDNDDEAATTSGRSSITGVIGRVFAFITSPVSRRLSTGGGGGEA